LSKNAARAARSRQVVAAPAVIGLERRHGRARNTKYGNTGCAAPPLFEGFWPEIVKLAPQRGLPTPQPQLQSRRL